MGDARVVTFETKVFMHSMNAAMIPADIAVSIGHYRAVNGLSSDALVIVNCIMIGACRPGDVQQRARQSNHSNGRDSDAHFYSQ